MSVQKAKAVKRELERLRKLGASATGTHANDVEYERLVREKHKLMSDLKPRGIKWEDL